LHRFFFRVLNFAGRWDFTIIDVLATRHLD
jgi:hypothetical protein